MKFNLKTPCSNCPFRTDVKPYLTKGRAKEICQGLVERQGTFSCHKTTEHDEDGDTRETKDSQHCAGAMILLEKMNAPNQLMRIAERFGDYNHKELDMEAPVFKNVQAFIKAQP
jgi:hypothetical protein